MGGLCSAKSDNPDHLTPQRNKGGPNANGQPVNSYQPETKMENPYATRDTHDLDDQNRKSSNGKLQIDESNVKKIQFEGALKRPESENQQEIESEKKKQE